MIEEIIWTPAAIEDFVNTNSPLASSDSIDYSLSLLRVFPQMGSQDSRSPNLRKLRIGPSCVFALYYGQAGKRLFVIALLDLRQSPENIDKILELRSPGWP